MKRKEVKYSKIWVVRKGDVKHDKRGINSQMLHVILCNLFSSCVLLLLSFQIQIKDHITRSRRVGEEAISSVIAHINDNFVSAFASLEGNDEMYSLKCLTHPIPKFPSLN